MLRLTKDIAIPMSEIEFQQIRSSGPGGQHVNKVATAVHLRFDINRSSLPQSWKTRLLQRRDRRIGSDGCIVIKAQQYRSLEKNKEDGLQRLRHLITDSIRQPKKRIATRPTRSSEKRRLQQKQERSRQKRLRRKVNESD